MHLLYGVQGGGGFVLLTGDVGARSRAASRRGFVAGIPFRPSIGPYAVTLTWALCVFGFAFVRTIETFLSRDPDA